MPTRRLIIAESVRRQSTSLDSSAQIFDDLADFGLSIAQNVSSMFNFVALFVCLFVRQSLSNRLCIVNYIPVL